VLVERAVQPCQVGVCKGIGWLPFILLGGASWTPAMAAVSLVVASMILLVAVISGTGMA
jgi:hypothetical protein